jgi:hypothetical protein
MKNIFLTFFMCLCVFGYAQTITKTASTPSARIGEVFEYTINISGLTALSELGSVEDVLDPNLEYLGSDFNVSSQVFAFYSLYAPASLPSLTQPAPLSSGTLSFKFPSSSSGSFTGGSISFTIKVGVKPSACKEVTTISNQVRLKNQSNAVVATSTINASNTIIIDHSNPWTIEKTFRSMTAGYLIYDIRLSSSVAKYYTNVLPTGFFTDEFVNSSCLPIDSSLSRVFYIPNEAAMNTFTESFGPQVGSATGLTFNWPLPSVTTFTPSSYLYQVKIKIGKCNCGAPFDLLNKVDFEGVDICGDNIELHDKFDMKGASCKDDTLAIPEKPTICVNKKVKLTDNDINLTMSGCTGNYIITIDNCTKKFKYTDIKLTDILPNTSLLSYGTASITPAVYASDMSITSGSLFLNSTIALLPGGKITITIPFTVVTPLPNTVIKNCAKASITLKDAVNPPITLVKNICDISIKTVPNNTTIVTSKKICNPPTHSCGGRTINKNLPNDIVEYALHVYNYGTGVGTNFSITDQIPNYFNIVNPTTDIKVYKLTQSGNAINDICDVTGFTDISPGITIPGIATGVSINKIISNKLVINFGSHELDKFTCSGITHYIVKIKAKIDVTAPNGEYTNAFQASYFDVGLNASDTQISNPVTSIVDKSELLFMDKTAVKGVQDCIKKTVLGEYEIMAINMGTEAVLININDKLNVPAPLTLVTGIHDLQYQLSSASTPGVLAPLTSFGSTVVSNTATTLNVNYLSLPPCTKLLVRYKIIFNANNVNTGQIVKACNTATVTAGYLVDNKLDVYEELTPINIKKDPELINQYFEATNDIVKYRLVSKLDKSNASEKVGDPITNEDLKAIPISINKKFVALASANSGNKCLEITDCLNGSSTGCYAANSTHAASLKINSISNTGVALTTLSLPTGDKKVRKVEYMLSDIRMITSECPPKVACRNCNASVSGSFNSLTTIPIAGILFERAIAPTSPAFYIQKSKVEFSNVGYNDISGSNVVKFQLPVTNLNCNGNLEVVITAIIYYEDCSVCYVSDAKDYNAKYSIIVPGDVFGPAVNIPINKK